MKFAYVSGVILGLAFFLLFSCSKKNVKGPEYGAIQFQNVRVQIRGDYPNDPLATEVDLKETFSGLSMVQEKPIHYTLEFSRERPKAKESLPIKLKMEDPEGMQQKDKDHIMYGADEGGNVTGDEATAKAFIWSIKQLYYYLALPYKKSVGEALSVQIYSNNTGKESESIWQFDERVNEEIWTNKYGEREDMSQEKEFLRKQLGYKLLYQSLHFIGRYEISKNEIKDFSKVK